MTNTIRAYIHCYPCTVGTSSSQSTTSGLGQLGFPNTKSHQCRLVALRITNRPGERRLLHTRRFSYLADKKTNNTRHAQCANANKCDSNRADNPTYVHMFAPWYVHRLNNTRNIIGMCKQNASAHNYPRPDIWGEVFLNIITRWKNQAFKRGAYPSSPSVLVANNENNNRREGCAIWRREHKHGTPYRLWHNIFDEYCTI